MNYLDKMRTIEQEYGGKELVIFGCGPSLNDYTKQQVVEFCNGKNVACIKQSFFRFNDICDFHFINDNNLVKYDNKKSFVITSSSKEIFPFLNMIERQDLHLVVKTTGRLKDTIANNNNFENNNIAENNIVNWGPGIMLECVIPFVVAAKFSKIYFLGWDYSKKEKKIMDHYYDSKSRTRFVNPTFGSYKGENELLIKNSCYLYEYLLSKNIQSHVLSKTSYVSSKFPRIKLNE